MTTTTAPVQGRMDAAPAKRGRAGTKEAHRLMPTPLLAVLTTLLCAMVLVPVAYILLASLNTDNGVASGEFWPSTFSGESYTKIWSTVRLGPALVNSLVVCGLVAVVSALVAVVTAYVLVRYAFTGRLTILRGLLGLQSIPGTLMLLPVFVLFSSAGNYLGINVIGTLWGLFIAYLTFGLPFSTWVMVTYLRGLPRELEEAARIDGASSVQILFRIIVPLSLPARRLRDLRVPPRVERRALRIGVHPAGHAYRRGGAAGLQQQPGGRGHPRLLPAHGGSARMRGAGRHPLRRLPALSGRWPDCREREIAHVDTVRVRRRDLRRRRGAV